MTQALIAVLFSPAAHGDEFATVVQPLVERFCIDCHGNKGAEGNTDIARLTANQDFAHQFKTWEKIVKVLQAKRMPPTDAEQPSESDRMRLADSIRTSLDSYVRLHAGDPGRVVMRRLTSAEYAYTITDLTGLDLRLEKSFVNDAVGGEGFTNIGTAQFMQDAALERYFEAAKAVADHAVIGAGPIEFFKDPGQTGRELSAIDRITRIYRKFGFRTAAGEGGEPFGLDLYSRAFLVAWRFQHRSELGLEDMSLEKLARNEGLSERFCQHVWRVVSAAPQGFPLSLIVSNWRAIPAPSAAAPTDASARSACDQIAENLREWQSMLAAAAGDEEEAAVLTAGKLSIDAQHSFNTTIDWEDGAKTAEFELSVSSASSQSARGALVLWKNPRLRFRAENLRRSEPMPLAAYVAPETLSKLALGKHPGGLQIGEHDFVIDGESKVAVKLLIPDGMIAAQLTVDVELDVARGADAIVRCRIADGEVEGETAAEVGATSALLGNPTGATVARWQLEVADFARLLPEVSHREPAPSDRDPIPPPFSNEYNKPERNHFHTAIKYHRDDQFLVEHILDDDARRQLDDAWTDLLTSFEYHDANLRFIMKKFGVSADGATFLERARISSQHLSGEEKERVEQLHDEYVRMQSRLAAAEPNHVDNVLRFAEQAWRRPLTGEEQSRLRTFYQELRAHENLDHTKAIRTLLTRILVAPAFLYLAQPAVGLTNGFAPIRSAEIAVPNVDENRSILPLSDWELASRLSYFLWSSPPDEELRRAAASGQLQHSEQLPVQARRMLRDPKARRFATEFFGQWFGFYRLDEFRGIDAQRFPEFDDNLRAAMYGEAITFFEHLVREDRPIQDILFADYTYVNASLAEHYGLDSSDLPFDKHVLVKDMVKSNRGGLLGMGAIHAVTSAPLRTSAVKRGDWVLRRVLGAPVPPPPADAGSIAADDVQADGLTVRRRLEAHRTDESCRNCHSRIDPLGFALEHFDTIGRWRKEYRDGQPIDPSGTLSDGTEVSGLDGLRQYLRREQPQFERNLVGKLLSYGLGRVELASDRPLIEQMQSDLRHSGAVSKIVARIVTSRQFTHRSN